MSRLAPVCVLCALCYLCVLAVQLSAQFQMPDPKQMSGIPRPVNDLPDRTVSVRLIRGQLSNNITNFPVELHIGGQVRTVKTDEGGRAEFGNLPAGQSVKAVAVVDGERLESQEFPAPASGGIRLMLVATERAGTGVAGSTERPPSPVSEPSAPAVAGSVVIGSQSRVIIAPGEDVVAVYYLLDVLNNARVPVNPPSGFSLEMPAGAVGTTLLEGTSPNASVSGRQVTVKGPFAPGPTLVQIACNVPVSAASLEVTQRFPAALEQLSVFVKKSGDLKLLSPQLASQQDMPVSGETFIAASGGAVAAGQPITLTLDGLPHHSFVPRWIALALAGAIVAVGIWAGVRPSSSPDTHAAERKRLTARREKLFGELVRLESDHRAGKVGDGKYGTRREEIVIALERVYGALDSDETGPGPAEGSALTRRAYSS